VLTLARNAVQSSFMSNREKRRLCQRIYDDATPFLDRLVELDAALSVIVE